MKRAVLAALLVLGSSLAAQADNDVYHDTTGRDRSEDVLHADMSSCSARVGPQRNGVPTSAAYKRCMRGRGWAWEKTQVEPGSAVCRATVLHYEEMPFSLNHHNVATMTLRVKPPRGPAFQTTITKSVSRHNPPHVGGTMSVRCDPANPGDIHPAD